jgi:glycyl-tRNA synthetase
VDKFQDMMVKDSKTGECFRADHLLEETIEKIIATTKNLSEEKKREMLHDLAQADAVPPEELTRLLRKYDAKAPETNNPISDAFFFNLMFSTQIGPTGLYQGFMRPETAQGIFVNFKRLLDFNGGRLPFAAAQIGPAFRNEISPRAGLLRVREFTMAEIEHFVDPKDKSHPKFKEMVDTPMLLLPRDRQMDKSLKPEDKMVTMTIGEAVGKGIVANDTLGYFLARTQQFLVKIGINPAKLRFRQHLQSQMAHYAADCWDAEIQSSYGWVECVGCADRSAYDLTQHSAASKEKLAAFIDFKDGPRVMEVVEVTVNKGAIGKALRNDAKLVLAYLDQISEDNAALMELATTMESAGKIKLVGFELGKEMISFKKVSKRVVGESVIPSVIEPSFGIGRILYSLFEHAYAMREGGEDEKRAYLRFKPCVAPIKCSILPLINNDQLMTFTSRLAKLLTLRGISSKVDSTGVTIGKRYARTDEIGIPFGITIDFDTLKDDTVTLRERDSMKQVRIPIKYLADIMASLVNEEVAWADILNQYPAFVSSSDE